MTLQQDDTEQPLKDRRGDRMTGLAAFVVGCHDNKQAMQSLESLWLFVVFKFDKRNT